MKHKYIYLLILAIITGNLSLFSQSEFSVSAKTTVSQPIND